MNRVSPVTAVFHRWVDAQVPSAVADDERPRVRVLIITLWLAFVLSVLSAALSLGSDLSALSALNIIGAVVSLVVLGRVRRATDSRPAVRVFLWAFLLLFGLGALTTTPMELTTLGYLFLIPLMASTMLEQGATGAWFARSMVVGSLVCIAGQFGWVVPQVDPLPGVTHVMNFLSVLVAAMALLRASANERERSLLRLREVERAKSAFFANVGHEIRTPMNGVLGMADALLLRPLGEDEHLMVQTIRSSGGLMLSLLDDLLDLSKIEAGGLALHPTVVPLRPFADELRGLWAPLAARKNLELSVTLEETLPEAVLIDGLRLRQILGNLINNAIKFTQAGSVKVTLRREANELRCSVVDTGIGVSPQQQARLFERFVQADDARARRYQGAGLGLSLCRELATRLGGRIELESKEGAGSSFTCSVPLVVAEVERHALVPMRELPPGLRVLVVDDNAVNRLVAQRLLDKSGCAVEVATDAQQAFTLLAHRAFDVVLMDVHMPEMDGLEATRRIRAGAGGQLLRIIGVSASSANEDIAACKDAGMNDFLPKPMTRDRLLDALQEKTSRL